MPVPLRAHKAERVEAKYNVVTEYLNLDLHSAAAAGNTGLVEYALSRGQPINSVLDGVLPLHAACAGGDEHVVKLLIDRGADVNAPRLPRRYSHEKGRENTPASLFQRPSPRLIVGTTGATPLHFAAANGNKQVIEVLLRKGAHPDRADKYGVTAETLARQNGWVECAEILQSWMENKDKDLRDRASFSIPDDERFPPAPTYNRTRGGSLGTEPIDTAGSTRRRLQMKRSIDTALNMLKVSSSTYIGPDGQRAPTPTSPTLSPPSSPVTSRNPSRSRYPEDQAGEPSALPVGGPESRRPSLPQIPTMKSSTSSQKSYRRFRRPRSAGSDVESPTGDGQQGKGRVLGGKSSFLGLFKKAQTADGSSSHGSLQKTLSHQPSVGSSLNLTSLTSSPKSNTLALPAEDNHDTSASPIPFMRGPFRHRMGSDASSSRARAPSVSSQLKNVPSSSSLRPMASSPPRPSAIEMHNKLGGSRGSASEVSVAEDRSNSSRPSILRIHNRTGSSGQGQSSTRALRFDSVNSQNPMLHNSSSMRSLGGSSVHLAPPARSGVPNPTIDVPDNFIDVAPPTPTGHEDDEDEDDRFEEEESYGQIIHQETFSPPRRRQRDRGFSVTSSDASISPNADATSGQFLSAEFPFSIHRPPAEMTEDGSNIEGRGRGNSLSSLTSNDSRYNSNLSASGTTTASSRGAATTPLISPHLEPYVETGESTTPHGDGHISRRSTDMFSPGEEMDIIASHAQAEEMVQRAQRDILEMDVEQQAGAPTLSTSPRLSLSERLALYGESLALERKLREQKEAGAAMRIRTASGSPPVTPFPVSSSDLWGGKVNTSPSVNRHGSLESKKAPRKSKQPRRPHTADEASESGLSVAALPNSNSQSTSGSFMTTDDRLGSGDNASNSESQAAHAGHSYEGLDSRDAYETPPHRLRESSSSGGGALSRVSSMGDGCDFSSDNEFGFPLSRVSTEPNNSKKKREQASTTKLTKMGFPNDAAGRSVAGAPGTSAKRFGVLRGLMHNLKGKP